MKHLLVTAVLILGLLSSPAEAAPFYQVAGDAAPPATTSKPASPDQILRRAIERLGGYLSGRTLRDPERIRAFLEREIAGSFDFRTIGRWVAGPYFGGLTPTQRERFSGKLRNILISAVARNLGAFARPLPRVVVYPIGAAGWRDERTVRVRVMPRSGYPIDMDFRFFRTPNGWKVFDVAANGASAVAYYRRYFAARISMSGPAALYD